VTREKVDKLSLWIFHCALADNLELCLGSYSIAQLTSVATSDRLADVSLVCAYLYMPVPNPGPLASAQDSQHSNASSKYDEYLYDELHGVCTRCGPWEVGHQRPDTWSVASAPMLKQWSCRTDPPGSSRSGSGLPAESLYAPETASAVPRKNQTNAAASSFVYADEEPDYRSAPSRTLSYNWVRHSTLLDSLVRTGCKAAGNALWHQHRHAKTLHLMNTSQRCRVLRF
jgi:hypothetical protein